jgi:hypothetical protein
MNYTLYIWAKREYYELYANNNRNEIVERGDFEPRYFQEIVNGRTIVLVSGRDSGDYSDVKDICIDNGIEYVNVAG